jgi:hypothetical protein
MPQISIQVDEAVAKTIRDHARLRAVSEEQCAAQILSAHHEEFVRFPDGVLREGREKIIDLLSQIPCLGNFKSSGIDFRYWWVSFEVDEASPIAGRVVRRLAYLLNTESAEMMLPTVFKPIPDEPPDAPMVWLIASTAVRLNPVDVEHWLRKNLPRPLSDADAWLRLGENPQADQAAPEAPRERCLPDLEDCEGVGQKHKWFNLDGVRSGCYNCRVVREGQLWRKT